MAGRSLLLTVVVLLEGELGRTLERWRRFYDLPGADRIPPHLTLVSPFVAEPPLVPLERHLWSVCHSWPPIPLDLGDVARDEGLFYVEVASGGRELARLRDALHTGPLAQAEATGGFEPRVIVAEPASEKELALASRQLAGLGVRDSYEVKRLHLMAAYPDGSWYVRDHFGLDGAYATQRESGSRGRAG